ncbi:sugar phosphate isomerase/epimerase family protein [Shouchella sp. JSM 1781072]|uniref:sugar phosphate isomerase/epimerase family protein n=1 Tax=Bacillaceae TaxID=186817 RepID=UPI0020D16CF9|nr:TIM barrel protein [Alkalihalobacillus sp. LMS6]UTR06765.1 TIM barrel protein [Alkalihalobacillus sp. LMS6]
MRELSLTSWSLNRLLGPLYWNEWDDVNQTITTVVEEQPQVYSLIEMPQLLANQGFHAMEIIHPHFPSTDIDYLHELRTAFENANIRLHSILIDYGDISTRDRARQTADYAFLKEWVSIAATVGAKYVRIIGGEARSDDQEGLELATAQLASLVNDAKQKGVGILTENFKSLTETAENCVYLKKHTGIDGLITDFGNFTGATKVQSIQQTIPHSKSIHVKALENEDGTINQAELKGNLDVAKEMNYEGPLTIVYDGLDDMWAGINRVKEIVKAYI